jgi:hypothetical protein
MAAPIARVVFCTVLPTLVLTCPMTPGGQIDC